jgi:hypothetical protein
VDDRALKPTCGLQGVSLLELRIKVHVRGPTAKQHDGWYVARFLKRFDRFLHIKRYGGRFDRPKLLYKLIKSVALNFIRKLPP